MSIFSFLRRTPSWARRVAVVVIIRHLTCPYCSAIQGAMTLGLVTNRVDSNMYGPYGPGLGGFNPRFRETHLSNPLRCSVCGKLFYAFVGVEYDESYRKFTKVDVQIVRGDVRGIEHLLNWPHRGLVMKEVIEYSPFKARVYDSLDHFEEYNQGRTHDIVISSLVNKASRLPPVDEAVEGGGPVAVDVEEG